MAKNTDIQVADRQIYSTTDYSKFKTMQGNREVAKQHVGQLQRLLLENGNLTNQFPIIVNEHMEVLDGQHRLAALKELGWEVSYVIEKDATINMVRAINLGNKNWNWRDMGESYEKLGNKEYGWFLRYVDTNNLNFSLALLFCSTKAGKAERSARSIYAQGYLFVEEKTRAVETAEHFKEAIRYCPQNLVQREFGVALFNLMKSPFYDEKRMLQKLEEKGHTIAVKATVGDHMRALETLFNDQRNEENRVRLF